MNDEPEKVDLKGEPGGWRSAFNARTYLTIVLAIAIAILVSAFYPGWSWFIDLLGPRVTLVSSLIVSLIFAVVPIVICLVQTTAKSRQLSKLNSVSQTPLAETGYFKAARIHVQAVKPVLLGTDYTVPLITFTAVVLVSCIAVFTAVEADIFTQKSVMLGGLSVLTMADSEVATYQRGTFVVGCMAFAGSYVYTLSRLLDRLTNNDLYPISFYYYTSRFIISVIVAEVFRHVASMFGVNDSQGLVLLGFVVGLAPDLFIVAMARRAFQVIKVFGSKEDPDVDNRPRTLPLLMLDDLTRDKIDRLNELGIDNAQVLACQNPFSIWPRLPYDLGLIVDWIAESQLYSLVKEGALKSLREKCVFDIFDFVTRLKDEKARIEICDAIKLSVDSADALLLQIREDQSYRRLLEVRDAMLPTPATVA